jgi:heptosyltransferase-1
MRVLIVKTSSMGDVIHTLPALTDAGNAIPNITFDWVVEENFAEIPAWHPLVKNIIPMAWRRWRKNLFAATTRDQAKKFYEKIRAEKYDLVIDAQGLIKSAATALFAKGLHAGPDWPSAREAFASTFYSRKASVSQQQHAVVRMRSLFSQLLKYPLPETVADYGVDRNQFLKNTTPSENPYLVFLHGTTWATKHWPESHWAALTKLANQSGYHVKLPWGSLAEQERAQRIAQSATSAEVLPRQGLIGMATILAGAKAITAVDTGLGHLAAALDVPTVSLYGPTNPLLTGAMGQSQTHLIATFPCAPCLSKVCTFKDAAGEPACFVNLSAQRVWVELEKIL